MKNAIVIATFANAVKAKVAKATELGTKTTWTTEDHLAAQARAVAVVTDPHYAEADDKGAAYVESIRAVLEDSYNVSGFSQTLEKAYATTGHFQRSVKAKQSPSDLYKALGLS